MNSHISAVRTTKYQLTLALACITLFSAMGVIVWTLFVQRDILSSSTTISDQQAFILVSTACKDKAEGMPDIYDLYLQDCIASNGYTPEGTPMATSTLIVRDGHSSYRNNALKFTFAFPQSSQLPTDNSPSLQRGSAITYSRIAVGGGILTITASSRTQSPTTFDQVVAQYYDSRLNDVTLTDAAITRSNFGIDTLALTESDASVRILFLSQSKQLIEVHAEEIPSASLASIIQTLATVTNI